MAVDFTIAAKRRREQEEREEIEREEEKRAANAKAVAPRRLTAQEEAAALRAKLDLDGVKLFGNRILVAKFLRTTLGTSGKLVAADSTRTEDKWQGKIGLVVLKGTIAFQDDADHEWHGDDVNVGDWVFFHYGDGTDVDIASASGELVRCKWLKEGEIAGTIPRPDIFY
jgi:hypothetical protein